MAVEFRLPKINAPTVEGRMAQTQSYLYQMVEQLNWALNTIESGGSSGSSQIVLPEAKSGKLSEKEAQNTFNSIKSLIIKSADVVEAYYDVTKERFDGEYLAKSDFGDYKEETERERTESAKVTEDRFNSHQDLFDDVNKKLSEIDVSAWIKSGDLGTDDNGAPIYGIEVGQRSTVEGVETFNKYSRFTADGVYFYLPGSDKAIAYLADGKLYITNAHITGYQQLGDFKIDTSDGLTVRWVGGTS